MRKRLYRENQAKDSQGLEELRRICCEETDRARPRTLMSPLSLHFPAVQASLLRPASAQATWPRERKKVKIERYPHINLAPFILETTGYHAKKFVSNLMKDAVNPPTCHPRHLVSYPEWSFTAPSPNNKSQLQPRSALPGFQYRLCGTIHCAAPFLRPSAADQYRLCGNTHCSSVFCHSAAS